jgi:hypothetical protein
VKRCRGASAGAGGAQKGAGVRGQATWPGISACVHTGPRWLAELRGRFHGTARESGCARKRLITLMRQAHEAAWCNN